MPTLVNTAGSASANAYASTTDGDTYFDERLNAGAWTGASTDDKERALIMASRRLDAERFQGEKAETGQALEWPRVWAFDKDGEEYASDAIPTVVQHATFELALRLLNDGDTDTFANTGLEEFKRAKVGEMEVERAPAFNAGQLPDSVRRILSHVLRSSNNSGMLYHGGNK